MNSMHFQAFAENNHRVFLLESIDGIYCGCGNPKCTAIGKHPVSSNWQNTPLWDEDQLENMSTVIDSLDRGYGVLCNNILVIDVDAKNGGVESYAALIERFPEIASAGLIVNTGSGGGSKHLYFSLPEDVKTIQTHKDFKGIDFKHSGFVVGPGSPHKSGNHYDVVSGSVDEIEPAPQSLIDFLKREERRKVDYEGGSIDISDSVIADMVSHITCYDEYSEWIKIGMAIHDATNGHGIEIWDKWSQSSAKYDREAIDARWHSFGKSPNPVTVGTLVKLAKENGWEEKPSFEEVELQGWFAKALTGDPVAHRVTKEDVKDVKNPIKGCPVDVSTIDLTMPPGFCGEVTRWINTQCRYPRHNLAAMASIVAISNIAGVNYAADDTSKTRLNMVFLGVAGSGTGKDAIINAINDLLHEAGVSGAVHGKIKSDRELYQNLIHHQAAYYIVDEIGARLAKISNSAKSGASHLDGVIETFMDITSKSNKRVSLGGDEGREMLKMLLQQKSLCEQKINDNEDKSGYYARLLNSVEKRIAHGNSIVEPFLSLLGFTTPTQVSSLMTVHNAEIGFLGRAIMVVEPDINPYPNPDFTNEDIPYGISMRIKQLATAGMAGEAPVRVERTGDLQLIEVTPEARDLIERCTLWAVDYNQSKIEMGMEPFSGLYRRVCEKAIKIAAAMGAGDGVIDVEHVNWAMAASLRDAEEKVSMITIEDKGFSKLEKLIASIYKAIKNKPGSTLAWIANRSNIKKYERTDIEKAFVLMQQRGDIRVEDDTDKRNNETLKRYYVR